MNSVTYFLARLSQYARRKKLSINNKTIKLGKQIQIDRHNFHADDGVRLGDYVRIKGQVSLGNATDIRAFTFLDARGGTIIIGNNCSINDYCVLYGMGNITIGNDVRIATHSIFVSGNHNIDDINTLIRLQGVTNKPIVIEDNVWIGANVTILSNVTIGNGAVIGAGAVVTKDIPALAIAVGNPARVIRYR